MLVAGEISKRLGILEQSELELLRAAVRLCGELPDASRLDLVQLVGALAHDKKLVGGRVQWVLLKNLGHATLVDQTEIAPELLCASLRSVLQTDSKR